MDLSFMVENMKLNIRVGCIIKHNEKILFHHQCLKDHYCLIGGRIQIGEDSITAVKREVMEELNKKIDVKGLAAVLENFFTCDGVKVHEIYLIYFAEFTDEKDKKIETTLENKEGKDYLKYCWLKENDIKKENILPNALKEVVNSKVFPIHKIIKED